MNDAFKILESFANQFSPEVEGRAAESLDNETREALVRLCRGELSDTERQQAAKILVRSPQAMNFLVNEISADRKA